MGAVVPKTNKQSVFVTAILLVKQVGKKNTLYFSHLIGPE